MWCHLCKLNFTEPEIFKCHILEKHRPESSFYKGTDDEDSDSEPEIVDASGASHTNLEICTNENDETDSGDEQILSDSCLDDPSSEENTSSDVIPKSSTVNKLHSENTNDFVPRRSKRIKKCTPNFMSYIASSTKVSAANKKKDDCSKNGKADNAYNVDNSTNNKFCVMNPVVGLGMNEKSMHVINPQHSNISLNSNNDFFAINAKNLHLWLKKHKELCKNLKYPLPYNVYKKIKIIHKELFSRYCLASPSEESSAILKVYEELNQMVLKHISNVNTEL